MRMALLVALLLIIGFGTQVVCAQDALTAKLQAQGGISVVSGDRPLAYLSLDAHGPQWAHAGQVSATAVVKDADPGPGKVAEGSLPIPGTQDGAVRFVETVTATEKSFTAAYSLGFTKAMTLNGLQLSLFLPADTFAGKAVVLHAPGQGDAAPEVVTQVPLLEKLDPANWQSMPAAASKIEIAPGTDDAITITPKLAEAKDGVKAELPRFVVQDLRKWDQNVFEVRLVLIMDDKGKQVSAEDKANTEVTVTFARGLGWQ